MKWCDDPVLKEIQRWLERTSDLTPAHNARLLTELARVDAELTDLRATLTAEAPEPPPAATAKAARR